MQTKRANMQLNSVNSGVTSETFNLRIYFNRNKATTKINFKYLRIQTAMQ